MNNEKEIKPSERLQQIVDEEMDRLGIKECAPWPEMSIWAIGKYLDEQAEQHAKKSEECECCYVGEPHGIEFINSPSGKQWSVGGTETKDRFKFCPWCGGSIPKELTKPSPSSEPVNNANSDLLFCSAGKVGGNIKTPSSEPCEFGHSGDKTVSSYPESPRPTEQPQENECLTGDPKLWNQIVNFFPAFQGDIGEENKRSLFEWICANYQHKTNSSRKTVLSVEEIELIVKKAMLEFSPNNPFYSDYEYISKAIHEALKEKK